MLSVSKPCHPVLWRLTDSMGEIWTVASRRPDAAASPDSRSGRNSNRCKCLFSNTSCFVVCQRARAPSEPCAGEASDETRNLIIVTTEPNAAAPCGYATYSNEGPNRLRPGG